jgi:tetratricopeptide (TPR) repeat protein
LCAALFLATNAYFFRYGYAATTDAPALALQTVALYLLLARDGGRAALLAGVAAALAFLTRYNAVVLLPTGLAALLLGGTLQTRRRRAAALFAAGFLAPVVPWVAYSLARGSTFSFQLHHNIAYDVYARAKGIPWDTYQRDMQPQFKTLWDVIARDPTAFFDRMRFNVLDHFKHDAESLLRWPVAWAALAGLACSLWDGAARRLWPVLLAGAFSFVALIPTFYSERYALATLPVYAALAAAAFASPKLALAFGRERHVWLKPVLAAIPLVAALAASRHEQKEALRKLPVEVLDAAQVLKAHARAGDRVMARKGHIGYYANLPLTAFPFADSLPQLADRLHATGTRWLYFSWPEAELRPMFYYLLDSTADVPGLTRRRVIPRNPAVLYEVGPEFGRIPAWFRDDTLRAVHFARGELMIDTAFVDALLALAAVDHAHGEDAAARPRIERALRRKADNGPAWALLGWVTLELGDYGASTDAFARAEQLMPGRAEPRVGRGWASLMAGRRNEAAMLWRPVIQATGNTRALERMVTLYRELGDRQAEGAAVIALARRRGTLPKP